MFEPIYLELFNLGEIDTRIEQLYNILKSCKLCPRKCGVDRTKSERGFCKSGLDLIVSSVGPHFWEEPELVGRGGSGTIFLTNCNLVPYKYLISKVLTKKSKNIYHGDTELQKH